MDFVIFESELFIYFIIEASLNVIFYTETIYPGVVLALWL